MSLSWAMTVVTCGGLEGWEASWSRGRKEKGEKRRGRRERRGTERRWIFEQEREQDRPIVLSQSIKYSTGL